MTRKWVYRCLHDHFLTEVTFVAHCTYKSSAPSAQRIPSLLTICPLFHRTYSIHIYTYMHMCEHVSQVTSEIIITSSGFFMPLHCPGHWWL